MRMKPERLIFAVLFCISVLFGTCGYASTGTGRFKVDQGRAVVYVSKNYMNSSRKKYAKIKLEVRDIFSFKRSGLVHLVLQDPLGNWISEWDARGGNTLSLGNDHSAYVIYAKSAKVGFEDIGNSGKAYYWSMINGRNCKVTSFIYGDVDGNGRVSLLDLSAVKNHVLGAKRLTGNLEAADLNGDGNISLLDVSLLQRFIVGQIDSFPVYYK